jgi:hypothetical protein
MPSTTVKCELRLLPGRVKVMAGSRRLASSKITPNRLQRRIAQAQGAHSGGRMIHDHDIDLSDESLNNFWGARVPQVWRQTPLIVGALGKHGTQVAE